MLVNLEKDNSEFEFNFSNYFGNDKTAVDESLHQHIMEVKFTNCLLYLKCMYCKENGFPSMITFTQKSITLCTFINGMVIDTLSKSPTRRTLGKTRDIISSCLLHATLLYISILN
jgi:hypothetical protein